ncbi:MAG: hypothetical protein HY736_27590 [Verrucomicrobia bacterium]|nr:hypothetical protein [Verrucomicrobiota bacterium]
MHIRNLRPLLAAVLSLGLGSSLFAQPNPPQRPRVGDLREEQRLIDNAYLGDADFQIKRARERLGGGNNRLAQQSGLWALEQVAYAKRRLERHAPKIEEAGGLFTERATESTRKELRDSYAKVREKYVNTEERLDALAEALKKAGLPILAETLNNVRRLSGDDAVKAVNDGLRRAGETGQGDKAGGETISGGTGGSGSATGAEQTNAQGVRFQQTPDGVLVIPPGTLIAGARLGPNGTIIFKDGTTASINDIRPGPGNTLTVTDSNTGTTKQIDPSTGLPQSRPGAGPAGPASPAFSGSLPAGVTVVDQNGRRITVGPDWRNGEQTGVTKDYIDVAGGMLDSEIKVVRRIIDASSNPWKIQETPGERRNWNFSIRVGDEKKASGSISFLLTVDGGGPTGFTIRSWEVVDASGSRAAVAPAAGRPEAVATFTKGGKYDSFAVGETDWGTPFRIKGPVIDAYP